MEYPGADAAAVCEPETLELAVIMPLFLAGFAGNELSSALLSMVNSFFVAAIHCFLRTLIKGSLMLFVFYGVISACAVEPSQESNVQVLATIPSRDRKESDCFLSTRDLRQTAFHAITMSGKGHYGPCAICLDEMKEPLILPCAHAFCAVCIGRWSRSSRLIEGGPKCPCCRRNFEAFPHFPRNNVLNFLLYKLH
jgi:hypothetical protein